MKLVFFSMDNNIEFDNKKINVLEIRNKAFFSKVLLTLLGNVDEDNNGEQIYLFDNDNELDLKKSSIVLTDFFNLNLNERSILSKVYKKMENELINNDNLRDEYHELINNISSLFQYIIDDINFELEFEDDIKITNILKSFNIKFEMENEYSMLDKLFSYIDVVAEFKLCSLLIIVNVKSYFIEEQLLEIYKYINHKKINVLFIESNISEKLECEYKLVIDEDFDEYISN